MLVVAGGLASGRALASTELYDHTNGAGIWRSAGLLPAPRYGLTGASLAGVSTGIIWR